MTNWLITGGAGFIGKALVTHLMKDSSNRIRILDDLSVGSIDGLGFKADILKSETTFPWLSKVSLIKGSILDETIVNAACIDADIVVHLAANTGVESSVKNPFLDCTKNVVGTLQLLESCRKASVKKFVFASSGAPLGEQTPPLHENLAPHPSSPYGASKLAGEGYCSAYYHSFGIETVGLRFSNVYGPGSESKTSVVAKFLIRAMDGKGFHIYGDGSQTRDFIYIQDLVDAIVKASIIDGIGGEIFQIANNKETSINELVSMILLALEQLQLKKPDISYYPTRIGDVKRNYSSILKAEKYLGFAPKIDLEEGLLLTLKSFLNNK